MSLNLTSKVLFPAPSPAHYTVSTFPQHLIWIPATDVTPAIPSLYLQYGGPCELLVIWSHGNGCDIGSMYHQLLHYSHFWRAHILAYEYPGYGICHGESSEPSINANIQAVHQFVTTVMKWPSERILFYGHSIGSGPTCFITSALIQQQIPVAGMILQSPYLSICDVAKSHVGIFGHFVSNRWNNADAIKKLAVDTPVLLIHGAKDTLIPAKHSEGLYTACPSKYKHLVVIDYADHNYFESRDLINPTVQFFEKYYRGGKGGKWKASRGEQIPALIEKNVKAEQEAADAKKDNKADADGSNNKKEDNLKPLPDINLDAKYWEEPRQKAPTGRGVAAKEGSGSLLSGLFAWSVATISGPPTPAATPTPKAGGAATPSAGSGGSGSGTSNLGDVKSPPTPVSPPVTSDLWNEDDNLVTGFAFASSKSGVNIAGPPVPPPSSGATPKQAIASVTPGGPSHL